MRAKRKTWALLACLGFQHGASSQSSGLLPLADASFETWQASDRSWQVTGDVSRAVVGGAYYGQACALLQGPADAQLAAQYTVELSSARDDARLQPGQVMEAGAWVQLRQPLDLPASKDPNVYFEIRLLARGLDGGSERLVARGRWHPTQAQADHWVFVKSGPLTVLQNTDRLLRIELQRSFEGALAVDFVQWGPQFSVDGNPPAQVGANYVGRYRAPQFAPGPDPGDAAERWRNWHWQVPTACSSSFAGFYHSPDCDGINECRRQNGRRDLAISPLQSQHDVPLAGAYDSRDPHILRYHLNLARAAGIDHFIYDYQGQALAEQDLAFGREPINAQTFQALVNECEAPGVDMKLAVMYEPKVHMFGWVLGQPTKAQKVAGITADLVWLARARDGQRSTLQHNGRMVVFIFRNGICDGPGLQCLDNGDWVQIHSDVLGQTGVDLFLVADTVTGTNSAMGGLTRWQLLRRDYLSYRKWSDARDGVLTLPQPQLQSLVDHTLDLDISIKAWVNQAPLQRLGIFTVWPGFDDSGVGGWGVENLLGEDGAPLCVRVADVFDGAFYGNTVARAFEGNYDWIQIATWNDWNESTAIEPAWHPDYLGPALQGQGPSVSVQQQVFGRLIETRQWVETFKGHPAPGPDFRSIASDYLRRAWQLPGVAFYD